MSSSHRQAVKHLCKDKRLAPIIEIIGECQMRAYGDYFTVLVEAIVNQQLSDKAGATIYKRLIAIVGEPLDPKKILSVKDEKLRESGISWSKVSFIKDLSQKVYAKELILSTVDKLEDEIVMQELMKVKGIGPWTAEMFLIFSLGRLDILSTGDQGLRRAMQKLYELSGIPDKETMIKIAESWRPYRSVASWYLWKSLEL